MKKALAIVFIVALASAGVFFGFFRHLLRQSYAERIFPQDTILYISIDNVERARKNLEGTDVWKHLNNSPRKEKYRKLFERGFSSFESAVGFDVRPLLDQFKGEIAIALFPLVEGKGSAGFVATVKDSDDFTRFLEEQIDPALKRRFPELKKSYEKGEDTPYYKYSSTNFPPDASPSYRISGKHFIFAINENGLRKMISNDKRKSESLRESEVFRKAKREANYERGWLVFLNVPAGIGLLEKSIPPIARRYWPGVLKVTGVEAVRGLIYTTRVENSGFQESGFVEVNENRGGLLKIYMEQKPRKMESLAYMPASMKMVSAGTLPDFAKMWDELNAQLEKILDPEQYQKWQQGMAVLRGLMNFDLRRDFMEPVGEEFAFSYEPGSAKRPLDVNYIVVTRLRNPDAFKTTIARMVGVAALRGMIKRETTYHGRTLQILTLNMPDYTLAPSYAFENKWFVFASRDSLLQEAFDSKDSGDGIQSTADFKKCTSGFPSEVHALSYTNVSSYLKAQAEILRMNSDEEHLRWIQEYSIDQELMDLSKVLSGNATYSKIEKNGIRFKGNSSIPSACLGFTGLIEYLPEMIERYSKDN
jgi:hypothetical protein